MNEDISKKNDFFNVFGPEHDRFDFPGNVSRVTAGHGGEALLLTGSEKTALLDCGMAYCGDKTAENLRKELAKNGKMTLDYVLLSHSHYDHIGALPFIKKGFPETIVCGSEHCCNVLKRPNAKKMMKNLGTAARNLYDPESTLDIPVDGLEVDMIIGEGSRIDLGGEYIEVLETKGHTDCSLSFAFEPAGILFTSESTGILELNFYVHTPVLKSFDDTFASLEKCRNYGAGYICLPHYGMLPADFNEDYWRLFRESCNEKVSFVENLIEKGKRRDEILNLYVERYWTPDKQQEQPKEAYVINSGHINNALISYIDKNKCKG